MKKFIIAIFMILIFSNIAYSMTLAECRGRIREYLYETDESNTLYSNTMIKEAITQAQYFVLDILPASANYNMLITSTIALANGTAEYSLPVDFRRVVNFKINGKQATLLKPEEYYNKSALIGTKDVAYCIIGSKLVISPTPTAVGISELLYMKQPAILTSDSSTLTTLFEFDNLVVLSAVQYLLFTDNQSARAISVTNEITKNIKSIVNRFDNTNIKESSSNEMKVISSDTSK